ncbi:MAG: hypothetical protein AAGG51_29405 [Cyanobacteria bacterium P01_G01_bin.54]
MTYTLLFLIGLGTLVIAQSPRQDSIYRLASGLTAIIALLWSYLWSPAPIQLGLPLLLLFTFPLTARFLHHSPRSPWD